MRLSTTLGLALLAAGAPAVHAQTPANGGHGEHAASAIPAERGQAAYAAISEVVRLLLADSSTDWSRVSIERLRRHLIDMNEVTMNAAVVQTPVADGVRLVVTGAGATRDAIRRMTRAHASQLAGEPDIRIALEDHPEGTILLVTSRRAGDAPVAARIRGLGFAGLMALGDHHGPHHLALAAGRGTAAHAGEH